MKKTKLMTEGPVRGLSVSFSSRLSHVFGSKMSLYSTTGTFVAHPIFQIFITKTKYYFAHQHAASQVVTARSASNTFASPPSTRTRIHPFI